MEPDDIQIHTLAYDDLYIPELASDVLATICTYADWELEVQIAADAMCALDDINPN